MPLPKSRVKGWSLLRDTHRPIPKTQYIFNMQRSKKQTSLSKDPSQHCKYLQFVPHSSLNVPTYKHAAPTFQWSFSVHPLSMSASFTSQPFSTLSKYTTKYPSSIHQYIFVFFDTSINPCLRASQQPFLTPFRSATHSSHAASICLLCGI